MQASFPASVSQGFVRGLFHPGILVIRWLLSLLAATWLFMPFKGFFERRITHSTISFEMTDQIPHQLYQEFLRFYAESDHVYGQLSITVLAIYILTHLFLSGGVFASIAKRDHYGPVRFWRACVQYFPAMIGSALIGALMAIICVPGLLTLWGYIVANYIYDVRFLGPAFYSWWIGVFAIVVLMGSAVWRIYDVLRLQLCGMDLRGMRLLLAIPGKTLKAIAFFVRYHVGTFAIFVTFMAVQALVIAVSQMLFKSSGASLWWTVQALILVRLWVGLSRVCAMHSFMEGRLDIGQEKTTATPQESEAPAAVHDPYASAYEQDISPSTDKDALEAEEDPFIEPEPTAPEAHELSLSPAETEDSSDSNIVEPPQKEESVKSRIDWKTGEIVEKHETDDTDPKNAPN